MRATVLIRPKDGILDPQGQAVTGSLRKLGFRIDGVRVGRVVDLELPSGDAVRVREDVERMCRELLANDLTESYAIEIEAP